MSQQPPSDEELRAALEEEMRRLTPEDVIVQSVVTLVNLAGRKLGLAAQEGEAAKDLGQARTAIEAVRALKVNVADHVVGNVASRSQDPHARQRTRARNDVDLAIAHG